MKLKKKQFSWEEVKVKDTAKIEARLLLPESEWLHKDVVWTRLSCSNWKCLVIFELLGWTNHSILHIYTIIVWLTLGLLCIVITCSWWESDECSERSETCKDQRSTMIHRLSSSCNSCKSEWKKKRYKQFSTEAVRVQQCNITSELVSITPPESLRPFWEWTRIGWVSPAFDECTRNRFRIPCPLIGTRHEELIWITDLVMARPISRSYLLLFRSHPSGSPNSAVLSAESDPRGVPLPSPFNHDDFVVVVSWNKIIRCNYG